MEITNLIEAKNYAAGRDENLLFFWDIRMDV